MIRQMDRVLCFLIFQLERLQANLEGLTPDVNGAKFDRKVNVFVPQDTVHNSSMQKDSRSHQALAVC